MRFAGKMISLGRIASEVRQRIYPLPENDTGTRLATKLAIEGLLAAIVLNLANAYTQMFASRMGATDSQIGLVASLPQFFALLVLIPGALLASRLRDRRRPVEYSMILAGIFYGLAGFSPFLGDLKVWFLIGMISLANAPLALYNTTWQNYFSDIVSPQQRNLFYSLRMSMTFFASMVIIQVTGIILGSARSDEIRIWLYQGCYWLAFITSLFQLQVMRKAPRDFGDHVTTGWRDLVAAGREMISCHRFMTFFVVSVIFHASWYMAWPLFFLTQVDYLGANETWLGLITVPASILQWVTVRPWSRFIERRGIRLALVIGCVGMAINPMLTMAAAYLPADVRLPGMLVLNLIGGTTFSAFQLSILQCLLEAVPPRYKAINLSVYTTFLLLANTIAPILGVQLYLALGSDLRAMTLAMAVSSSLRLFGSLLFLLRWRRLRNEPDCGIRV